MEGSGKVVLGYWKIRGLVRHIQYVAEYCGVDYEVKYYSQDSEGKEWFDEKPTLGLDFPNNPYLIHGDFKMTDTFPIMFYLADKFRPEILGETPEERATVNMVSAIIKDAKVAVATLCYTQDDKSAVINETLKRFEPLSKFLGDKHFFMGDKVTIPDLFIVEMVKLINAVDGGSTLNDKYPNIQAHHDRVCELAEVKAFESSERCQDLPYNGASAKINP
jgi:glutathione S-transferase